jgi:hypothetical protein
MRNIIIKIILLIIIEGNSILSHYINKGYPSIAPSEDLIKKGLLGKHLNKFSRASIAFSPSQKKLLLFF